MSWTLQTITEEHARPFVPTEGLVKVLAVYDGDTITVAKCMDQTWYRFHVRILGIDTPEIKTTNAAEKQHGLKARDYLEELIGNQIVYIANICPDKYGGRFLARVTFIQDDKTVLDIASHMIARGWAVAYDGKKKLEYAAANYVIQ